MCNRSGFEQYKSGWYGGEVVWDLSSQDISKIDALSIWSNSAGAGYEALAAADVGGLATIDLASGVGLALTAVVLAYYGWITWSNSGCGVKIHLYLTYSGATAVYIESQ